MRTLPYRRLFFRTALHIGVALTAFVVIGAVSVLLIAATELQGYVETRDSTLGQEAAMVLEQQGTDALRDWLLNEAEVPADVSVYVLDENSRDLLGRQLPIEYVNFIRESVVGEAEAPDSNYRPVRLAPQIIAPDGQRFAFLVIPKDISIWGSPATLVGLLAVALAVISSVAWLIARALSQPIGELQLAVRELASGHTTARVPSSISRRNDELGSLAADFNTMADQLSELISGREALMREMSHELRSPLARMHAALALAVERNALPQEERAQMEREIERMNRVIGEMLRYSRMDTETTPRQKLVRIDKLLNELISDERTEAQTHECTLHLSAAQNLTVLGDSELLRSCFENVLRNAIRYAPAQSTIDIRAAANTGSIQVEIADRGPGVPVEHLEKIFEPYFRVASGGHHKDSTGLGLAIVKRIAKHHGGTVQAIRREGGGLSVKIRLPAADLS